LCVNFPVVNWQTRSFDCLLPLLIREVLNMCHMLPVVSHVRLSRLKSNGVDGRIPIENTKLNHDHDEESVGFLYKQCSAECHTHSLTHTYLLCALSLTISRAVGRIGASGFVQMSVVMQCFHGQWMISHKSSALTDDACH